MEWIGHERETEKERDKDGQPAVTLASKILPNHVYLLYKSLNLVHYGH